MTKISNDLAFPRLCGLLADRPTKLSQAMHNAGFRALSLDFHYVAFDTTDTAGGISAMRVLGFRGLSLTIPHKEAAVPLVDRCSDEARAAGSINTILNDGRALTGYNTDIFGITESLREAGFQGESVLLAGAGGAARAGIIALKKYGLKSLTITNRTNSKAEQLAAEFGIQFLPWERFRPEFQADLFVNATPAGSSLTSDAVSNEFSSRCPMKKGMTVFDMVTRKTTLIRQASLAGAKTIPGSRMLLFQALEQFRLFTGEDAPREVMEGALLQAFAV